MKAKRSKTLEEPTINLTPLIDVVFVVLIMFIIIAPILEKDRIELSQNQNPNRSSKIEKNSSITLHINSKNQLFLNKKLTNVESLESQLKQLKKTNPDSTPQVYYDKKAFFELFEPIKCALENSGYDNMDLILEPAK
jgi:biopolymer transport protein ExbD